MRKDFYKHLSLLFLISLLSFLSITTSAQQGNACDASTSYLYWTGEVDNDFFNEGNWRIATENNSGTPCHAGSWSKSQINFLFSSIQTKFLP